MNNSEISRRRFLEMTGLSGLAVGLAACGAKSSSSTSAETAAAAAETTTAAAAAADTTAAAAETAAAAPSQLFGYEWAKNQAQWAQLPGDHAAGTMVSQADWYKILGSVPGDPIDLALFKGGFGDEWGKILSELMEKEHPGAKLNFTWDPDIAKKIQPRLLAGDVPDFLFYGFNPWDQGVKDKQAMPGDFVLDVEGYGGFSGKRLQELFVAGSLASANPGYTDHTWAFPQTSFTFGIFYNGKLFDDNGWPDPSTLTWEDFMALQAEIVKVIPAWAYAGANAPGYFGYVTQPLIYKTIGAAAWCDLNNVVEGAWKNEGVIWAIEQHQQIIKNGWLLKGTEAMSHTESQQAFVEGKCAMIPNGSWLASEQKSTTPAGFDMRFAAVPAPKDAKGDKAAVAASLGGADMMIGNGKNPLWALEVMRLFYSPEMAEYWAKSVGSPLPLVTGGSVPSTPYSESITAALAAAGDHIIADRFGAYEAIGKTWGDNYQDLIHSKISAQKFTDLMERAADETRKNPDIKILPVTCL